MVDNHFIIIGSTGMLFSGNVSIRSLRLKRLKLDEFRHFISPSRAAVIMLPFIPITVNGIGS
jgi:hypothetical protein